MVCRACILEFPDRGLPGIDSSHSYIHPLRRGGGREVSVLRCRLLFSCLIRRRVLAVGRTLFRSRGGRHYSLGRISFFPRGED